MAYNEPLIGKRERISVVNETSFGTGGTMSNGYIPGYDCKLDPNWNKNWMDILTAGADNRYIQNKILGPKALPFTLSFVPVHWKWLQFLGYSVVDAGSNPYTHTFSISNTIQSFITEWAWRHTTPVVITLTGCFCTGGSINFQKASGEGSEGFIKVNLRCFAKTYSIGSSTTTLASGDLTRTPFAWKDVLGTLDNNAKTRLNSGMIDIDNGITPEESRYCNTTADRDISEPIPGIHKITGRMNLTYYDSTEVDLWDSDAVISNCSLDFNENNTNNKIEIDFASFRAHQAFSGTDFEGAKKADLVFSAQSFSSLISTDSIETY